MSRRNREKRLKNSEFRGCENERANKKYFRDSVWVLMLNLFCVLLSFFWPESSIDYYKIQSAVLLVWILNIMAGIVINKYDQSFWEGIQKLAQKSYSFTLKEKANLLLNFSFIIGVLGILTVDAEVFKNGELRIGGVVAVNIARIVAPLFRKRLF